MNDVNLMNVVDQVKTWAKRNEAILVLASALEKIGQIEQAKIEQERGLIEVNAKLGEARAALASVNEDIHRAGVQAEDIRAAAQQKADGMVREAADEVEKIRAEAIARLEQERSRAYAETAKMLADAKKEKAEWMNEAKIAEDRAEAAIAKEDAAKRELAQLQDRLAKARAAIKQMVGE